LTGQKKLTFRRGELTDIATDIGLKVGYKPDTVRRIIGPKYRELAKRETR
jgi:hypothetical protein